MPSDNKNVLLRTTDNTKMSLEQSKSFSNTKRKIDSLCSALTLETQKYDLQESSANLTDNVSGRSSTLCV